MNIDLDDLKPGTQGTSPASPSSLSDELGLAQTKASGSTLEDIYDRHMKLIYVLDVSSSMEESLFDLILPEHFSWPYSWRRTMEMRIENAKVRYTARLEDLAYLSDEEALSDEEDWDEDPEEEEEKVFPVPHQLFAEDPCNDDFWISLAGVTPPLSDKDLQLRIVQDQKAWQELGLTNRDGKVRHSKKITALKTQAKKMIRERFKKYPDADVSLIEFEVGAKLHTNLSLPALEAAIDAMTAWGYGTQIVDAIVRAIGLCKKSPSPVKSHHIVLVSDGEDYGASNIDNHLLELKRLGIVFDFIHICGLSGSTRAAEGASRMKRVCAATGGAYTQVSRMSEFDNRFLEASRRLCLPAPSQE